MDEPQEKGEVSRSSSDEELRTALARAVADAARVIGGGTAMLPFDGDAGAEDAGDEEEAVPEAETTFVM